MQILFNEIRPIKIALNQGKYLKKNIFHMFCADKTTEMCVIYDKFQNVFESDVFCFWLSLVKPILSIIISRY
jgi:hypothetical protein